MCVMQETFGLKVSHHFPIMLDRTQESKAMLMIRQYAMKDMRPEYSSRKDPQHRAENKIVMKGRSLIREHSLASSKLQCIECRSCWNRSEVHAKIHINIVSSVSTTVRSCWT